MDDIDFHVVSFEQTSNREKCVELHFTGRYIRHTSLFANNSYTIYAYTVHCTPYTDSSNTHISYTRETRVCVCTFESIEACGGFNNGLDT